MSTPVEAKRAAVPDAAAAIDDRFPTLVMESSKLPLDGPATEKKQSLASVTMKLTLMGRLFKAPPSSSPTSTTLTEDHSSDESLFEGVDCGKVTDAKPIKDRMAPFLKRSKSITGLLSSLSTTESPHWRSTPEYDSPGKETDADIVSPVKKPMKDYIPPLLKKKMSIRARSPAPIPPPKPTITGPITVLQPSSSGSIRALSPPRRARLLQYPRLQTTDLPKGERKPRDKSSSRDSKFSSFSSTSSPNSPASSSLSLSDSLCSSNTSLFFEWATLNQQEFSRLQSLLRRCSRRLYEQQLLASNYAANLQHQLARKEARLQSQSGSPRRARKLAWGVPEQQSAMLQVLKGGRKRCAQLFQRKETSVQRSFEAVGRLRFALEESERGAKEAIPAVGSSKMATEGLCFIIGKEAVDEFVAAMRREAEVQRHVDQELETCVLEKARESRWANSGGERMLMQRFVEFVQLRGRRLEECYAVLGKVVGDIEGGVMENQGGFFDEWEGRM